jgi:hypothetical protein
MERQYVQICHLFPFDEFIYFEPSPQSAIVMYDASCQPILMGWSKVADVNSHDGLMGDWDILVPKLRGARGSALGVFVDRRKGR